MISLKIAIRFLKSGGMQTIMIIVGIAVAIAIQVYVGLLIESLQRTLVDRTIGNSPQITIVSSNDISTIRDWQLIVQKIQDSIPVKDIAASASSNAFIEDGNSNLPVIVKGYQFDEADKIYNIRDSIYEGRIYESSREVLVGKDLKEELEINLGDKISVKKPDGGANDLYVAGFYDLGVANINKTWLLVNLTTAQRFFNFGNRVSSVDITTQDVFEADTIARDIERELDNKNLKIENWKQQNQELLSGLEGQRISSIVIQAVVIISVIIAISSVLAITVLQKSREIGILKAMGIRDLPASLIFIYQGFLVGLLGATIGTLLGISLLYGFVAFTTAPDGSSVVDLYIGYDFIIRSWLIALSASTIAGILPARRSLRLNPVEVIREG
ncbi:ABC transporter permease [Chloroflexota bacterium]